MQGAMPELRALAQAARQIGADIAKTKDELEKLVFMIVKDTVRVKTKQLVIKRQDDGTEKEVEEEVELERPASVEDMISATLILVLQDEKFRRHVPGKMLEQLMIVSTAVRDYEERQLYAILPNIKARIRSDLIAILHRAYPAWQSLVPDATSSMMEAMVSERKKQDENSLLSQYRQQQNNTSYFPPGGTG